MPFEGNCISSLGLGLESPGLYPIGIRKTEVADEGPYAECDVIPEPRREPCGRQRVRTQRQSESRRERTSGGRISAALTAASASCFFCRMSVAVLSLCFSNSLKREKHKPHVSAE